MSFWENFGESLGYGIGAMLFGPKAALEHRTRRTLRRAFASWLSGERYTKQTVAKHTIRRLVERQDAETACLLECELHYVDRLARISVAMDPLPERVKVQLFQEEPDPTSATLEHEVVAQLVLEIAESSLRDWTDIEIVPDRFTLAMHAPETSDGWNAAAEGTMKVISWLQRRFRGGGYR